MPPCELKSRCHLVRLPVQIHPADAGIIIIEHVRNTSWSGQPLLCTLPEDAFVQVSLVKCLNVAVFRKAEHLLILE